MLLKWIGETFLFILMPAFFIFQTVEMIDGLIQMLGDLSEWSRYK